MPAIAGALVSPAIQNSILKGARETRPLVRLVRGGPRAALSSEATHDASKSTCDGSFAPTPHAETPQADANALPAPAWLPATASLRCSPAYKAPNSKFRNLSKQSFAAANTPSTCEGGRLRPVKGGAFDL